MQFEGQKITTFLTFFGQAEEAMNFYTSLFDHSEIRKLKHNSDGKLLQGVFALKGQSFMCSDSPPVHDWSFTPAVSLFIECESEEEIQRLFDSLTMDGKIHMPLNNYGFSRKFGWVDDKFGVSWQLNLV